MRGRILKPFYVEFGLLDTLHTRKDDPDGPGPLTGGYDDDFKELLVYTDTEKTRHNTRQDRSVVVPAQIETDTQDALEQKGPGNDPDTMIRIIVHRKDLEARKLIDCDSGEANIRVNDKLLSIRNKCNQVIFKPRQPYYVTQVATLFGIGELPDLLRITVENREQFVRGQ